MTSMKPLFLALAMLGMTGASHAQDSVDRPWNNPRLSPERRAELLDARLTLDEELGLLWGDFPRVMKTPPPGSLPSAGFVDGVPRLGIPPLLETDASLGIAAAGRKDDEATPLPSGLALAATWNPEIAYAGGAMIGREARQKGFNVLLAGGMNLVRDPRNGRNFEYVGEDPLLAAVIAGQSIRGIQSNHIVSTAKHFVLNAQETGRHVLNAELDPAALRESDLLAFEMGLEIGRPGSVMCAYNRINGPYACENAYTLGALKHDWGWKGWVMSDWGAVHSTVPAVLAGLDQESGRQLDREFFFGEALKKAVRSGTIPRARIHDMVKRVLWGLFASGLMDDPVHAGGLDTAADAKVAGQAADQGIVLLKNAQGLLPLAGAGKIAVIGGRADIGVLSGGGSSQVIPRGSHTFPAPAGSPTWTAGMVFHPFSPLEAIEARAKGAQVVYRDGTDVASAVSAARQADVVIVFATQWATEGADVSLTLSDRQDDLIRAVAEANPHTIVVLETGGPVFMPWRDRVAGVVEAWYPGARGADAITGVLFGDINPSGRLPVTFPLSEAQLPRPVLPGSDLTVVESDDPHKEPKPFGVAYGEGADIGYRWFEKTGAKPLFPFGYGLSYTTFGYSSLNATGGERLKVSFRVTNTGKRGGFDTPQVYAAGPGQTRRLIGWRKIWLDPGQSRDVDVVADPRLLARFDTARSGWRLKGGVYRVWVSQSASDAVLQTRTALRSRRMEP
jgi:beta-glucosidase